MTVKLRARAVWTTLLIYLLILGGNLAALFLILPRVVADFRTGPELPDFVSVVVSALVVLVVAIMINAFVRLARLRIRADDKRVWIPRSFGIKEVSRADLTVIRADRLSSPLAKGVRVFRFIRRDGAEAFHVQAAVFNEVEMQSLASYLGVPIELQFPR